MAASVEAPVSDNLKRACRYGDRADTKTITALSDEYNRELCRIFES